jgi:hypothetical protein
MPPTMSVQASDLGAEIPVFTMFSVLTGQLWHYSLLTFRGIRAILKGVDFVHTEIDEGLAGTEKVVFKTHRAALRYSAQRF